MRSATSILLTAMLLTATVATIRTVDVLAQAKKETPDQKAAEEALAKKKAADAAKAVADAMKKVDDAAKIVAEAKKKADDAAKAVAEAKKKADKAILEAAVAAKVQVDKALVEAKAKWEDADAKLKADEAQKKDLPEEKFDQKKADIETIKTAGLEVVGKPLLEFFQKHTISDGDQTRLNLLIKQLGDEDFDKRESATDAIEKFGIGAIGLLKQAERNADPEVLLRCERCLKNIEKVPTRTLAAAAARLLGQLKPEGASAILLNYLPLAEDDSVGDEVRGALAAVAMNAGKPDAVLAKALESKEALKRGAAAEAFARGGDNAMREQMRKLLAKDSDSDLKMRVALALVTVAKNKEVVAEMIKLMADVPPETGWKAEEVMVRLAGEKGPNISMGSDKASREKARDEWLKWWKGNEKDFDLAKLDQTEATLGYTLLIEMDIRGVGGRVREVTPDGKTRWEIVNVQFPTDAIVLPGNRVIVAEQNNSRVSERDTTNGKEIWGVQVQQPVGLQRLPNGNIVVIGRNQILEWDHQRKAVATINRQQYDIVAGCKLRNGQFAVYNQLGQVILYDKDGKQVGDKDGKMIVVNNKNLPSNYNSTMQLLPNGKLLVTQQTGVAEVDLNKLEMTTVLKYSFPSSAQRLPNGNFLVGSQNNFLVAEMDPKANKSVWEFKPDNKNDKNRFYRPWRARRR